MPKEKGPHVVDIFTYWLYLLLRNFFRWVITHSLSGYIIELEAHVMLRDVISWNPSWMRRRKESSNNRNKRIDRSPWSVEKREMENLYIHTLKTWGRFHQTLCAKRKDAGVRRLAKNSPFNFTNNWNSKSLRQLPNISIKMWAPFAIFVRRSPFLLRRLPYLCAKKKLLILFARKSWTQMLMKSTLRCTTITLDIKLTSR